ncbi:glycosyltransferase [Fibrobacterota bacterium]
MELPLVLIAGICWWTGTFLLWKIPLCRRGEESDLSQEVSVIIPARNEAHNLPKLLASLKEQDEVPKEIIVADDSSEDGTAEAAHARGVTVLPVENKPEDWNGKSFACWSGAEHASGSVLLFLDADTRLDKAGLGKIVSTWRRLGGLLSIQPYHQVTALYEKLSAVLNIMVMAGFNVFTPLGHRWKPPGSFGPCIICAKEDYFTAGGHEAVKSERLEDIPFGKNFMRQGFPVHCYGGAGSISFRMYPGGMLESIRGWAKSFAIGASSTSPAAMAASIVWISGLFFAAAAPITLCWGWLLYAGFGLQMYWMSRRIGSFGILPALLFPVPLMFFLSVYIYSFINSFLRKQIIWKGRTLTRD